MFGRKDSGSDVPVQQEAAQSPAAVRTVTPEARPQAAQPAVRRGPHEATPRRGERESVGERKLTVGKGLSLSGEINACDVLVVEGKVEAKLSDGKLLEITESGQFRGSVEIENADIAGRYDGQLTVHGRLTVRGTGRISGMVKYGELEIVAGGQIIGELQVVGGAQSVAQGGANFKSAAKFAGVSEDGDKVANS